jgi:ABC-2 type transport system ATP-binding protein
MSPAALQASGLVKRSKNTIAFDHVDLDVPARGVRGLHGPNRAGKTMLLATVFGP